jgi:predicted NBD/HSP70 family sugar kinase
MGFDGQVLSSTELHVDASEGFAAASERLAAAIEELTAAANRPSYAVVSVAMPFRPGHGAAPIPMHSASDGPRPSHRFRRPEWLLTDPTEALTEALGTPVMIENDANLAALGEAGHGAARDAQAAVHINVVTGFGAGLIIGGRLFRGAGGVAGELAHVSIREGGDICVCGNRGCVITVRRNGPSMVDEIATALGHVPTMSEIITLAGDGDVAVARWLTDLGRLLAQPLAGFVTLLNPDLLVVDGALGPAAVPVVNGIRETIEHRTPPMTHRGLHVRPGHLTTPIPVGAAVLAHQTYIDELLTAPHTFSAL